MYKIRKVFSKYQKEFARKDYQGLSQEQKIKLKKIRSDLAKSISNTRKELNDELTKIKSKETRDALRKSMYESQLKVLGIEKNSKRKMLELEPQISQEKINKPKEAVKKLVEEIVPDTDDKVVSTKSAKSTVIKEPIKDKEGLVKRATTWMRKNPGMSIAGGLGLAALGTGGLLGYQHYKNKKKNNN